MSTLDELRYPIGTHVYVPEEAQARRSEWIARIAAQPATLRHWVADMSDAQLDTPYRPGGWTVRQVVHHLADSHLNAFVRTKLALTEDNPTVKPYEEARWAETPDGLLPAADVSLRLLEGLHQRWALLLNSLNDQDFARTYFHPEHQKQFDVQYLCSMYAWHGDHHIAQISSLCKRAGW